MSIGEVKQRLQYASDELQTLQAAYSDATADCSGATTHAHVNAESLLEARQVYAELIGNLATSAQLAGKLHELLGVSSLNSGEAAAALARARAVVLGNRERASDSLRSIAVATEGTGDQATRDLQADAVRQQRSDTLSCPPLPETAELALANYAGLREVVRSSGELRGRLAAAEADVTILGTGIDVLFRQGEEVAGGANRSEHAVEETRAATSRIGHQAADIAAQL